MVDREIELRRVDQPNVYHRHTAGPHTLNKSGCHPPATLALISADDDAIHLDVAAIHAAERGFQECSRRKTDPPRQILVQVLGVGAANITGSEDLFQCGCGVFLDNQSVGNDALPVASGLLIVIELAAGAQWEIGPSATKTHRVGDCDTLLAGAKARALSHSRFRH
jgi:hypothetical protein